MDEITNKRNQLIVRIWNSFCFNIPDYKVIVRYLCNKTNQGYLAPHLETKFVAACNQYGSHAAMNVFYSQIDKQLREELVDFSIRVYAAKSMYLSDEEKALIGI